MAKIRIKRCIAFLLSNWKIKFQILMPLILLFIIFNKNHKMSKYEQKIEALRAEMFIAAKEVSQVRKI